MSYGPYRLILIFPPGVPILFLLVGAALGTVLPISPPATETRLSFSVLSVGGTGEVLARVGFDDTQPICSAVWPFAKLSCHPADVRPGDPERLFLESQAQYLAAVRNASGDAELNLGISYSCVLSESGVEECRVVHVKAHEPFSTSVLRRGDPGVGLFLNALGREASARWSDVRRRLLDLDARSEVRHRFRTTLGETGNATVCEVWTDTPVETKVLLVGPELKDAVSGVVVYDSGTAYGRVAVETAGGEDVSLLVCEVSTAAGLRSRFYHPSRSPERETEP